MARLVQFFGIPYRDGAGLTLAGLRPGGATWAYLSDEPLLSIQWRGRWSCLRTLEHYIQEAASVAVLANLPADMLATVHYFAACSELLLGAASGLAARPPCI